LEAEAVVLRVPAAPQAEAVLERAAEMPAAAFRKDRVLRLERIPALERRFRLAAARAAHIPGHDACDATLGVEQRLGRREAGQHADAETVRLLGEPAAQLAEADHVVPRAPKRRRHERLRTPHAPPRIKQPLDTVLADLDLDRRAALPEIGIELRERPSIEQSAGNDMRADLGALLDDADRQRRAVLGRELPETACGRKPGRTRADDHDVEAHRLARRPGIGARRRAERGIGGIVSHRLLELAARAADGSRSGRSDDDRRRRIPHAAESIACRAAAPHCNIAPDRPSGRPERFDRRRGRRGRCRRSIVNTERIEPIWRPSDARIAASLMRRFIERHRASLADDSYASLYRWSIDAPEAFWPALAEFAGVRFAAPASQVLVDRGLMP